MPSVYFRGDRVKKFIFNSTLLLQGDIINVQISPHSVTHMFCTIDIQRREYQIISGSSRVYTLSFVYPCSDIQLAKSVELFATKLHREILEWFCIKLRITCWYCMSGMWHFECVCVCPEQNRNGLRRGGGGERRRSWIGLSASFPVAGCVVWLPNDFAWVWLCIRIRYMECMCIHWASQNRINFMFASLRCCYFEVILYIVLHAV